jgi:Spy/CpxP family protein refolding chaperone
MKRILFVAVVASLVASAVSFVAMRWLSGVRHPPIAARSIHDLDWLQGKLQLSPDQMAKIRGIEGEYLAVIADCCEKHCGARYDLSEELAKEPVDLPKATGHVEAMSAAQARAEKATLDHILKVREILSSPQRTLYAQLVNQQVCTACPTGAHHP